MYKKIAILSGDGIGPEVMNEAIKILNKIAEKFGHTFEYIYGLIGGAAFDRYGNHFPDVTKEICKNCDAILFGSVGGPIDKQLKTKWINCEKKSLLGIRKEFNFHANFRPVKIYKNLVDICPLKKEIIDRGINFLFVRELVGGIYFGEHKTCVEDGIEKARDVMDYDENQIRLIVHDGFKIAQKRRKKLCSVDKANVLDCSKLWRKIVDEVAKEYLDVEYCHMLVDNCAMQLIQNPSQFDVILTENTFGDILSDEASVLAGSLGLMPSASLNKDGFGLFEPSGGSAQDIAGKNIANPIAQILSSAMMLKYSFGMTEEALCIENAINKVLEDGYATLDIYQAGKIQVSTIEMCNAIVQRIE